MAQPASPTPVIPQLASSMSSSTTLSDQSTSETDIDSLDFSSSDDEAGVFFGAHRPVERKIVAALSRSIPASPAAQDLSRIAGPRRSSLANRVKKRDSREFLRRKTLLLPSGSPEEATGDKVWEGGFYEKAPASDQHVQEAQAGPSRSSPRCEPSLDVPTAFIEANPEAASMVYSAEPTMGEDGQDEETDKENYPASPLELSEEEDAVMPASLEGHITIGFGTATTSPDVSTHLDLGGLSLFDIDDPETGPVAEVEDVPCDAFGDSADDSDSLRSSASDNGRSFEGVSDPFISSPSSPTSTMFVIASPVHGASETTAMSPKMVAIEPVPTAAESQTKEPLEPVTADDDLLANVSDTSYASDMNSPIARGPVVIPVFSVPSPAHPITPIRGLEPAADLGAPDLADDMGVDLPTLDSPTRPFTSHPSSAPPFQPLFSTPAAARVALGSPVREQRRPPPMSEQRANGASESLAVSVKKAVAEERTVSRANAIHGQLDLLYTSKLSAIVGPPQRAVAPPSSTSEARPPRPASDGTKPKSHRPLTSSRADNASSPVRRKAVIAPMSAPASAPMTAPASAPIPKGKVKPMAPPPEAKSGLPRLTRRPMAPPSSAQPLAASKPVQQKILAPVPRHMRATASTTLKRPHSAMLASHVPGRVSVSGAQRPMASRPLRDSVAGPSFGSQGFTNPHSAGPLHLPVAGGHDRPIGGPLSQPPFRSPARMTLGKPSKLQGATPTAQRTLKGLGTPSRSLHGTPLQLPAARPHPRGGLMFSESRSKPVLAQLSEEATQVSVAASTDESKAPSNEGHNMETRLNAAKAEDGPNGNAVAGDDSSRPAPSAEDATPASAATDSSAPVDAADSSSTPKKSPPRKASPRKASPKKSSPKRASPQKAPAKAEPKSDECKPEIEEIVSCAEQRPEVHIISPKPRESPRTRRSTRTPRPPPPPPAAAPPRAKPQAVPSIAPGLSEKELRTATTRNTRRNEVFFCAIDRQIVRVPGPRPPSPTSKIRTTAERDEEERKAGRGVRARRRARASNGDVTPEDSSEDEDIPVVELVAQGLRAPGDEDDYKTPVRKRAKVEHEAVENTRFVRWNRALTVIRGGLGESHQSPAPIQTGSKSCLKAAAQVPLDKHGNVVERPLERLKRSKVTVTAVFYDGEEPVPIPSQGTRSKGKK